MNEAATLETLSPEEVMEGLRSGRYLLVDVREPHEHHAEAIEGAVLHPLSRFDPAALPRKQGCEIVLHCGSGKRSAMAVAKCLGAGHRVNRHLAGGIIAWKARGLPTVSARRGG
ncbi:MAG: rhodanese-like domain-containing protein [Acetobacteraceae bacterium]